MFTYINILLYVQGCEYLSREFGIVRLPHIIYIYMFTMLPVVYKGFYTDVIFIRKINANLFLQEICVCKINHYLLHKTKYIFIFCKASRNFTSISLSDFDSFI